MLWFRKKCGAFNLSSLYWDLLNFFLTTHSKRPLTDTLLTTNVWLEHRYLSSKGKQLVNVCLWWNLMTCLSVNGTSVISPSLMKIGFLKNLLWEVTNGTSFISLGHSNCLLFITNHFESICFWILVLNSCVGSSRCVQTAMETVRDVMFQYF